MHSDAVSVCLPVNLQKIKTVVVEMRSHEHGPTLPSLAMQWIFKEKEKGVPNEELYQVLEFAVWAKEQSSKIYYPESESDEYFY